MTSLFTALALATVSEAALRIMPVGDSITQWHCGPQARVPADPASTASYGGWRGPLFTQLQAK